jgi:hypothetical protein
MSTHPGQLPERAYSIRPAGQQDSDCVYASYHAFPYAPKRRQTGCVKLFHFSGRFNDTVSRIGKRPRGIVTASIQPECSRE